MDVRVWRVRPAPARPSWLFIERYIHLARRNPNARVLLTTSLKRSATADVIRRLLSQAAKEVEGNRFSDHFLWTEWDQVVDEWQVETWEAYRDIARLGRKTRYNALTINSTMDNTIARIG